MMYFGKVNIPFSKMDKKNVQKRKDKILLDPLFLQHFGEKYWKTIQIPLYKPTHICSAKHQR